MVLTQLIANAQAAAKFLTLVANEKRLVILSHLIDEELSVGAIAERVSLSQSALSQHLAKLRGLDLVQTRRDRQTIYYSCKSEAVRELLGTVNVIFTKNSRTKVSELRIRRPRA